jgi:structural maintenance of chromosome 1
MTLCTPPLGTRSLISKLELEANEKLAEVMQKLLQAGVDKSESEREVKLKETLSNLQRTFTGGSHFVSFF